MFSLIYAWINDWVNSREAGDLRRQRGHYDVILMDMGSWNSRGRQRPTHLKDNIMTADNPVTHGVNRHAIAQVDRFQALHQGS